MSSAHERVRAVLSTAIAEFDWNSASRADMRQCAFEDSEPFLQEGLRILLEADESASYRFLAILIVALPAVCREISDRWQWKREEAILLGKQLIRVNPHFDERMTGLLPGLSGVPKPFGISVESAERALEILDEISPGRRIVSMIKHLTAHSDERVSSKAALLIGKRSRDTSWARRVIKESKDARLRANTVESFWGVTTPEAVELFHECLRDCDNRVVGNAIIGLHTSGDPVSRTFVAKIARDSNPKLRMTAAWTMGQIGDPQFVAILSSLARDEHAEVRRTALKSLRSIHVVERRAKRSEAVEPEPPQPTDQPDSMPVVRHQWAPAGLGVL